MKNISDETRRKMSESAKRRCTPEWIERQKGKGTKLDIDKLKSLYYEQNMSQTEVAEAMGVSQKVVFSFMKRNNLPSRKASKRYQQGDKNSYWKGGRRINEQGYVEISVPGYKHTRPNGYVREHIYIAEKMLGRRLKFYGVGDGRNEVVHHINGNKTDNREENLLILTATEHRRLHNATEKEMVDEILLRRIRELESEISNLMQHFQED